MTPHWLERPATIRRLWIAFIVALAATVAAELAIDRPATNEPGAVIGFYAWYAFGAGVTIVLLARLFGLALRRPDDGHDR